MTTLVDRIMSFETHCIETNNPEGAEVLHYSVERIKELETALVQSYNAARLYGYVDSAPMIDAVRVRGSIDP